MAKSRTKVRTAHRRETPKRPGKKPPVLPKARKLPQAVVPTSPELLAKVAAEAHVPNPDVAPTPEQVARFVGEYRISFNATRAAIAAGYKATSASSAGSRLLGLGVVQELLQRATLDTLADANVRTRDILTGLMEIAFADPAEAFDAHGRLLPIHQMPRGIRRAIAATKTTKMNFVKGDGLQEDVVEVKFWPKVQALEVLAKHKGLLKEIVEHQITVRQLEKLSDEELIEKRRQATEKLERHLAAQARLRSAAKALPPAQTTGGEGHV